MAVGSWFRLRVLRRWVLFRGFALMGLLLKLFFLALLGVLSPLAVRFVSLSLMLRSRKLLKNLLLKAGAVPFIPVMQCWASLFSLAPLSLGSPIA